MNILTKTTDIKTFKILNFNYHVSFDCLHESSKSVTPIGVKRCKMDGWTAVSVIKCL